MKELKSIFLKNSEIGCEKNTGSSGPGLFITLTFDMSIIRVFYHNSLISVARCLDFEKSWANLPYDILPFNLIHTVITNFSHDTIKKKSLKLCKVFYNNE